MDSAALKIFFNIFLASIQLLSLKAFVFMFLPKHHYFKYIHKSLLCQHQIYTSGISINHSIILKSKFLTGVGGGQCIIFVGPVNLPKTEIKDSVHMLW